MLDVKETNELISRAKSGDNAAKEKLLTENANLIKSIVRRYLGKGVEYDDLYQLAGMGLLKAINGFDQSYGVRFSTYAVPMIAGEIKRFMRDDGSIKVSRAIKAEAKAIKAVFGSGSRAKVSSTKAISGHGLSLAGVMEAGFTALSMKEGIIPGSAHIEELDPAAEGLNIPRSTLREQVKTAMSISSGFGGANTAIIFEAV